MPVSLFLGDFGHFWVIYDARVSHRISATGGDKNFPVPPLRGGDIWGGTGLTGGGHEGGDRSAQGGDKKFCACATFL